MRTEAEIKAAISMLEMTMANVENEDTVEAQIAFAMWVLNEETTVRDIASKTKSAADYEFPKCPECGSWAARGVDGYYCSQDASHKYEDKR